MRTTEVTDVFAEIRKIVDVEVQVNQLSQLNRKLRTKIVTSRENRHGVDVNSKTIEDYDMIRSIKIEDAEAIQRICNISLGYSVSIETVMKQIQKLSEDVNHHYIYVYEDEELQNVVGFVHAEVYESLYSYAGLNILGLAVLPEFQGKGIGKELMNYLELKAKDDSIPFIRLNSADHRVEAHKFYENIGYVCDKTQKRFIKRLD